MEILSELHAFLWESATVNNCNTYLIYAEKKILVDPGHYHLFSHVRDGLSELSLSPNDIDVVIITHAHPDHLEAVRVFMETSALIAVSAVEMDFIRSVTSHYGDALGIPDFEPHILLSEGDLNIANVNLQVIQTPGHSPGSICLYWSDKKALFSGDVVFSQGIGRTDLPGGKGEHLKESIQSISRYNAEYLLPGHGDILSGREAVKDNFENIEGLWFPFLQ